MHEGVRGGGERQSKENDLLKFTLLTPQAVQFPGEWILGKAV